MSIESNVVPMLCPDGSKVKAKVDWESVEYGECRVQIDCQGRVSEGRRTDYFDALEEARLPFEADGYRLLCYGASLNVFPSGMGRSCALGMESYQFREKGPKGSKIIFKTGKDVIPATVKEQRLFHLKWRNQNESEEVEYDDEAFQWQIEPHLKASGKG